MRSFNIMPTVLMSNLELHDDLHNRNLRGDNLNLSFWGNGGELARGFYSKTNFYMAKHTKESIINFLFSTRILRNDGLILHDGIELVKEYLRTFVTQAIDDGFPLIDIPDVLYAYQRAARRGGLSARGSSQLRDVFSPCCSRPFVEAAFSMPALQRYTQPLHYNLTRLLSPEIFHLPLDKDPWHFQQPLVNFLHVYSKEKLQSFRSRFSKLTGNSKVKDIYKKSTIFNDIKLFEAKREEMREKCLDQKIDSSLWNIVDRTRFDKITSSDFDPTVRKSYVNMLHRIVTLCYYDADDLRYAAPAEVEQ
jgi:asparagine synthase (glutamine-hydrolysing)